MEKTNEITEKEFYEFLELLSHLNPIEFFGIATWLQVPCFEDLERKKPRDTESLMSDILDGFLSAPHAKRKEIIKMMKQAIKAHLKKKK